MTVFDTATSDASSLDIAFLATGATALTAGPIERYAAPMSVKDTITKKLSEAFAPESLDVMDESHLHEGHSGHRPGGETHFRVYIVSQAFEGKARIERHRAVNTLLAAELAGGMHALAIRALTPGESRNA